ncbi:TPA: transposase [Clostridioides difficile]
MYSKSMSTRDISSHLKSIYGIDIYHSLIAKITDKVILRTLIYTINSMESCNRLLRKVTKSKSIFPSDDSLHKSLYLATMDISEK